MPSLTDSQVATMNKAYMKELNKMMKKATVKRDVGVGFDNQIHIGEPEHGAHPMPCARLAEILNYGSYEERRNEDGVVIEVNFIPPRPFMSYWINNTRGVNRLVDYARKNYFRFNYKEAGKIMEKYIKQTVYVGMNFTPNAWKTIKIKKSARPLIDTNELMDKMKIVEVVH